MPFLYNKYGDKMKIYIDLILILNFFLDLILELSVAIILKREITFYRLIISSFIGGLSVILLFLKINNLSLFVLKVIISIIMILISFKFKNIKYFFNNILFFYINSIVLGGFLYFINLNLSNNKGVIFIHNNLYPNFITLVILSPIIIYLYIHELNKLKNNYHNYYDVCIYLNGNKYSYVGYFDSANNLKYKNHPVILINEKKIKVDKYFMMPYQALNHIGLLKIIKIDKLLINNKLVRNCFLGLMEHDLNIDGVDILLNNKIGGIL